MEKTPSGDQAGLFVDLKTKLFQRSSLVWCYYLYFISLLYYCVFCLMFLIVTILIYYYNLCYDYDCWGFRLYHKCLAVLFVIYSM